MDDRCNRSCDRDRGWCLSATTRRSHRAAAVSGRQPPGHADQPRRRRQVRPDVDNVKVYGVGLLGRELLLRPGPRRHRRAEPRRRAERADQQRVDHVPQPRRLGAHVALGRRAESRRAARQHDAAARAERAARQRHRQRRAVSRGPRRRHGPERSGRLCHSQLQHEDGPARPADPRREVDRIQRHRGRRRRNDLRDADGRRRPDSRSDDVAGVEDHAERQPRRSSSRARRCVSPTASPSTRRGTSSSSTSAPRM